MFYIIQSIYYYLFRCLQKHPRILSDNINRELSSARSMDFRRTAVYEFVRGSKYLAMSQNYLNSVWNWRMG